MAARMEQLIQSETPAPDIGTDVPRLDVDPFEVRHLREPYSLQRQLRDAGPVVWLARQGTYGAAGFAEVQQILQNPAHFSSAARRDGSTESVTWRSATCTPRSHRRSALNLIPRTC
jgi:hypothetical protein